LILQVVFHETTIISPQTRAAVETIYLKMLKCRCIFAWIVL